MNVLWQNLINGYAENDKLVKGNIFPTARWYSGVYSHDEVGVTAVQKEEILGKIQCGGVESIM